MLGVLGQLLPVGLAAAISSVPITAMILILLSPRRNVAALPFLLGSVIGLLVVVALATFAAQGLPDARAREPEVAGLIEIVVGCALCVLGVWTWPRRGRSGDAATEPTWAAALDSLGPVRAFGLAAILDLRPKSLLLAAVVGVHLYVRSLERRETFVAAAVYVAIATSTVTIPILLTILAPQRMEPRLRAAAGVLSTRGPIISSVVLIMIGALVIGAGLGSL